MKCIFVLLKKSLNSSGSVYGQTVVLKNCHIRTRGFNWIPKMYTQSLAVIQPFTGQQNTRYCCPNNQDLAPCFTEMLPKWAAFLCGYPLLHPYFLPTKN